MKRRIGRIVREHVMRPDYRTMQGALDASKDLINELVRGVVSEVGVLYRKYYREVDYDVSGNPDVGFIDWLKDYLDKE